VRRILTVLLSCRFLTDVGSVNSYDSVSQFKMGEGEAVTVYLQLIDASKDRADQGFNPAGRRFVPASGATLQVILNNVDTAKTITKNATLAYSGLDHSIWRFDIASTDKVVGTVNLTLSLTESAKITKGIVLAGILSQPLTGIV
jgi:hypothetical protein